MQSENLFRVLGEWVDRGWIRPLDRAFVRFLKEQQPDVSDAVLTAAVLASHQLGRGHICLDLWAALADPELTLSLPPEGDKSLFGGPSELLSGMTPETWEQSLSASSLVAAGAGNTPLVLSSGRLYLRRYWQFTQQVARGILQRIADPFVSPDDFSENFQKNLPKNQSENLPKNLTDRLDALFGPLRSP